MKSIEQLCNEHMEKDLKLEDFICRILRVIAGHISNGEKRNFFEDLMYIMYFAGLSYAQKPQEVINLIARCEIKALKMVKHQFGVDD